MTFIRSQASELAQRLKEPRRFIQVVPGARFYLTDSRRREIYFL